MTAPTTPPALPAPVILQEEFGYRVYLQQQPTGIDLEAQNGSLDGRISLNQPATERLAAILVARLPRRTRLALADVNPDLGATLSRAADCLTMAAHAGLDATDAIDVVRRIAALLDPDRKG
jgi:hypothetical protein